MLSLPPATKSCPSSLRIALAASMTLFMPLPQALLTRVPPTVSGRPAPRLICRGRARPVPALTTLPTNTSSISPGATPLRATAARTTWLPRAAAS